MTKEETKEKIKKYFEYCELKGNIDLYDTFDGYYKNIFNDLLQDVFKFCEQDKKIKPLTESELEKQIDHEYESFKKWYDEHTIKALLEMSLSDALSEAYMCGYEQRDNELRGLNER